MAPPVQPLSEEYRALVDKAYNKFARLREFPQYGRNKWDFYFHKAFQVGSVSKFTGSIYCWMEEDRLSHPVCHFTQFGGYLVG